MGDTFTDVDGTVMRSTVRRFTCEECGLQRREGKTHICPQNGSDPESAKSRRIQRGSGAGLENSLRFGSSNDVDDVSQRNKDSLMQGTVRGALSDLEHFPRSRAVLSR